MTTAESAQTPAAPTPVGAFNLTQTGAAADKSGKDTNFRGLTAYNGVLHLTKGSGGNGVNAVYYVDTSGNTDSSGRACPSTGTGLPAAGQKLPTTSVPSFNTSNTALGLTTANPGLAPTNVCILTGFPTLAAKSTTGVSYPFGVWFANPTTMYVADEDSGGATYAGNTGGLQKMVLANGTWTLQYTLQTGLNLGQPCSVNNDAKGNAYPTGANSTQGGKAGDWAPVTDGLRNLIGRMNPDGTATVWAVTSTVSGSGDTGADPNQLVAITDTVAQTGAAAPSREHFTTVLPATDGTVYRGVSFTPGITGVRNSARGAARVTPGTSSARGRIRRWSRRTQYPSAAVKRGLDKLEGLMVGHGDCDPTISSLSLPARLGGRRHHRPHAPLNNRNAP